MRHMQYSRVILHRHGPYIPGAEMIVSRLCGVVATVATVIAACWPSPASVAAVTEMVYSAPAARPWKVWFKATPARRTS